MLKRKHLKFAKMVDHTSDDLYARLNIERSATQDEIKKAYRKAALQHHPDKAAPEDREDAEVRFKAVSEAYEILFDEQKREVYDRHGMSAFDGSNPGGMGGAGGPDLDDILAQMFGMNMGGMPGGMPGGPGRPRKGQDEEQQYGVSLEDLYKGRTVKFASTKNVVCGHCKGKGGKEKATAKKCSSCEGLGRKEQIVQMGGLLTRAVVECKVCEGLGSFFSPKDKCKRCKGKKVVEEKKLLEIYIPRGARTGDKIILEGEGDQTPDVEPGDIIFHIDELDHAVFKRAGSDLLATIEITLAEALCGFSRVVLKHLDGRGIELTHPRKPGDVLRPGQVLKVPGEGMPHKRGDTRGDLYLKVDVKFPDNAWAGEEVLAKLKDLLPGPGPAIKGEPVDEVDYNPNGNLDEYGAHDAHGGTAWEDDEDDEGSGPQCAAQ